MPFSMILHRLHKRVHFAPHILHVTWQTFLLSLETFTGVCQRYLATAGSSSLSLLFFFRTVEGGLLSSASHPLFGGVCWSRVRGKEQALRSRRGAGAQKRARIWGMKVYCDPCRGQTYKESGVPLKASGVSPCTPVGAAVTPREADGGV